MKEVQPELLSSITIFRWFKYGSPTGCNPSRRFFLRASDPRDREQALGKVQIHMTNICSRLNERPSHVQQEARKTELSDELGRAADLDRCSMLQWYEGREARLEGGGRKGVG